MRNLSWDIFKLSINNWLCYLFIFQSESESESTWPCQPTPADLRQRWHGCTYASWLFLLAAPGCRQVSRCDADTWHAPLPSLLKASGVTAWLRGQLMPWGHVNYLLLLQKLEKNTCNSSRRNFRSNFCSSVCSAWQSIVFAAYLSAGNPACEVDCISSETHRSKHAFVVVSSKQIE